MEIILIRHGRPLSATNQKLNAAGFAQWVRDYNRAGLHPHSIPHQLVDLADHYIVSSQLKRAQLSAERYCPYPVQETSALLNEMEIPRYRVPLHLNAWSWVTLNRALWFAGRKGRFESFASARVRTIQAAHLLEQRAKDFQRVAVFGHGMSNLFIRKALKQRGWKVIARDNAYWGVNRLQKSS